MWKHWISAIKRSCKGKTEAELCSITGGEHRIHVGDRSDASMIHNPDDMISRRQIRRFDDSNPDDMISILLTSVRHHGFHSW